MSRTLSLPV
jgi:hypothetical protein